MLSVHLAPSLLVVFMVMLAVVPMAIIWLDDHRRDVPTERLARLRDEVRLREQLSRSVRAEAAGRPSEVLRQG